MRRRLFLSTLVIILITLLLSMFSVNLVFQRQFSYYLTHTTETALDQLPDRLSSSYLSNGCWDPQALDDIVHTLPLGTEIVLKDPSGKTLLTLVNPMETMMHNSSGMGMGMGMNMGMSYSVQEWKTKTLNVNGPQGLLAIATVHYPASARILNPADVSFVSAIYRSLLLAGSLALLIGILLSYWTSRRLVSPLQRLTKAVHRVGQGHLDEQVPISTKDEVGQLATAFNDMANNLKKQEYLRKQFTADIAHELRTPLTSIRSYIEAFQDGVLQADAENLTIINEEIKRLVTLSSDLKDLNVAEIGALKPNFSPINIEELLDKVVYSLYPLIQEKEIDLEWEKPKEPIVIQGDEHLLTRLFYNLIHNAYKYTQSKGQISIRIDNSTHNVRIRVRDSGIGISEEDLPYIFERFYRADKSRARETGGTGIGLALVQQIIQLHQGMIGVESNPGQGSEFTVILPKKAGTV
jgi:two-component system, OmpR family, sensor histidine kinase BaeS